MKVFTALLRLSILSIYIVCPYFVSKYREYEYIINNLFVMYTRYCKLNTHLLAVVFWFNAFFYIWLT